MRRRLGLPHQIQWQPTEATLRKWDEIRAVPGSPLVSVVGVGRSVDAAGVTVELLAVEIRTLGAVLHWRAHSGRTEILLSAFVSVADLAGTPYRVIAGGSGGGAEGWEGQTLVLAAPVAGARLSITIERFGPEEDRPPLPRGFPSDTIAGPWQFDVDIPAALERT